MLILLLTLACTPLRIAGGDTDDPRPPDDTDTDTVLTPDDTGSEHIGDATGELFSQETIHRFELVLNAASVQDLNNNPTAYTDAILMDGKLEYEVGIRIKGTSSYQSLSGKPSFKIDVNRYRDQAFRGVKKLNLHNMYYDPMLMSEELAYGMFRDAGVPAPRTGFARLSVNGSDYGLYSVIEVADDEFLERWFEDGDGNLYENLANYCDFDDGSGCFDCEEDDEGHHEALEALILATTAPEGEWETAMEPMLNWEHFHGYLAMEMGIANWDSYSYDQSNYRVYHEPTLHQWSFIVSSADLAFAYRPWSYDFCGMYALDMNAYDMGLISKRCQQHEACSAAVLERLTAVADQLEAMDTTARIEGVYERIRDEVYSDPRKPYSDSKFEEHVVCVTRWLEDRPDEIRAWIEEQGPVINPPASP